MSPTKTTPDSLGAASIDDLRTVIPDFERSPSRSSGRGRTTDRFRRRWRTPRSTPCYHDGLTREITQRELRNDSGEIMRQLDTGESFIVTRNGVPVGELSPLRRHRFVRTETVVALFRHAPRVDPAKLRDDLDRVASQEMSPRG